jgi:hypothetical protein
MFVSITGFHIWSSRSLSSAKRPTRSQSEFSPCESEANRGYSTSAAGEVYAWIGKEASQEKPGSKPDHPHSRRTCGLAISNCNPAVTNSLIRTDIDFVSATLNVLKKTPRFGRLLPIHLLAGRRQSLSFPSSLNQQIAEAGSGARRQAQPGSLTRGACSFGAVGAGSSGALAVQPLPESLEARL